MIGVKNTFFLCLFSIFLLSCGNSKNINPDNYALFDDNGGLRDCPVPDLIYKSGKIRCFIESSGSMSGFFQANRITGFKSDVWSVLNEFYDRIDSVRLFRDASEPVTKMALADFRRDMNAGNFKFAGSTHIPQMLKELVLSLGKNDVGMFISDMKYSPMGSQAEVLLTQYGTDVKNVIKNTPYAFSIIGLTSSYIAGRGKAVENCPYYIILIGNDLPVNKLKQKIMQSIRKENLLGEISFYRKEFPTPMYTLLANRGIVNGITYKSDNNLYYTIGDINKESDVTFYLAADLSKLPHYLLADSKLLMQQLEVKADDAKATIEELTDSTSFDFGNGSREATNKIHATHFMKIKVTDILDGSTEVSVSVKRKEAEWISAVYGARYEAEYNKTISFEQLITGLKGAYNTDKQSMYYYKAPFVVLITEGKR